jgi:hypothetical protein
MASGVSQAFKPEGFLVVPQLLLGMHGTFAAKNLTPEGVSYRLGPEFKRLQ